MYSTLMLDMLLLLLQDSQWNAHLLAYYFYYLEEVSVLIAMVNSGILFLYA